MGSLSYGLERAPSRLVFENALLGRQFVDFPIGNGKNRGRAQRAIFFLAGHTFQSNLGLFARNHMWIFRSKAPQIQSTHLRSPRAPNVHAAALSAATLYPPPSPPPPFPSLPFSTTPFPTPPTLLPPPADASAAASVPAAQLGGAGFSLGSARLARLGSHPSVGLGSRLARRSTVGSVWIGSLGWDRHGSHGSHGSTRLLEHGGRPCTAAAARHALLSAWRSSAQLGSARLSSSRFVWLGLARLVQHDPHGSHLLGGAPCRRHLRAQPCAAQARRGAAAL